MKSHKVAILKFLSLCLLLFLFFAFNLNCSLIPGVNQYRISEITRGPQYTPYSGLKKRIAVLDFENVSLFGGEKIGSAIADQLISQLARSNRFILVERSRIDEILQEQGLGQSGLISEQTAAKVGQLLGVESIITGRILKAGQETGAQEINNEKDKWKLALKATMGFAHVSYRMISTATGEVLLAKDFFTQEIRPGLGIRTKKVDYENMFDFDQTVVGIAFRKAVNKIAADIVSHVNLIGWTGKIVQAKSDTVIYFTPGKAAGIRIGQTFEVFDNTGLMPEADIQMSLAEQLGRPKARVKVSGFIGDKVSRARVLLGNGINRGDLVKPMTHKTNKQE